MPPPDAQPQQDTVGDGCFRHGRPNCEECFIEVTCGTIEIDHVTRAVDQHGAEWVPIDEYRRVRADWETLRCMIVNPHRNVRRSLRALTEDKDELKARDFLGIALGQLDAAYETAFPPKVVAHDR